MNETVLYGTAKGGNSMRTCTVLPVTMPCETAAFSLFVTKSCWCFVWPKRASTTALNSGPWCSIFAPGVRAWVAKCRWRVVHLWRRWTVSCSITCTARTARTRDTCGAHGTGWCKWPGVKLEQACAGTSAKQLCRGMPHRIGSNPMQVGCGCPAGARRRSQGSHRVFDRGR